MTLSGRAGPFIVVLTVQSLNVSHTEFNKNALEMVMQDLPLLEHLNISSTRVTDVASLLR